MDDTPNPHPPGGGPNARPAGLCVLLADDDILGRKYIQRILELTGHRVTCAGDGAEALALLSRGGFDIAIVDIVMPSMSGDEVVRRFRGTEAGQESLRLPILALTACNLPGDKERLLESGFDDCIDKPASMDELLGAIARLLAWARHDDRRPAPPATRLPQPMFPTDPSRPPAGFDRQAAAKRFAGREAFWAGLAREFVETVLPRHLSDIRLALDAADLAAAEQVAHTLKGACGTVCAARAEALARQALAAARTGDLTAIPPLLDQLDAERLSLAAGQEEGEDASGGRGR